MLAIEDRLRHPGRRPSTLDGISRRLLRMEILKLVAKIRSSGITDGTLHDISRLLRSLDQPRIPGLSVFPEFYVMSIWEREGTYNATLDPYLEAELLGPSVGDTVFDGVSTVLEESYGLRVEVPSQYKWNILRGDTKAGYLTYDREKGHRVRRLRAILGGRTIVFCYRPVGLTVETSIHFIPSAKRRQIRSEVLPALRRKEEEFALMLGARPSDFLASIERALSKSVCIAPDDADLQAAQPRLTRLQL
jgi:hypothetical protein